MTSDIYRGSFAQKMLVDSNYWCMCYINSLYLAILLLKLQWHTGVYEEMFHVNSKIAETMQNIWNFVVGKSSLQEEAYFNIYTRDFRLWSGDQEVRSKIWSPLDYSGELTALPWELIFLLCTSKPVYAGYVLALTPSIPILHTQLLA